MAATLCLGAGKAWALRRPTSLLLPLLLLGLLSLLGFLHCQAEGLGAGLQRFPHVALCVGHLLQHTQRTQLKVD
jgi:hypothetical protein